jgi:hypothetical protein
VSRTPGAPLPSALLDYHRSNNRASADLGDHFAAHRARLTELILDAGGGDRLALLGAGNGNDVDLAALAGAYQAIHLIDLDAEAVRRARDRQPPEVAGRLLLQAPVDLSGVLAQLAAMRASATLPAERLAALPGEAVDRVLAAVPERFDSVVSCCLLSQLMHSCFLTLGKHPQLSLIAGAVALAHLRALVGLARPGGRVLLATDTVSSESYPLEELWGQRSPGELLAHLEATGNVLSGTAPTLLRQLLTDPQLPIERPARFIEPWLWRMDASMSFLVYAVSVTRGRG